MEVYYIGLFILTILWIVMVKEKGTENAERQGLWCLCAWLILSLIEGLRSFDIGTDTSTYAYLFATDGMDSFESGFQGLGKFIHVMTNDPTFFLLTISLITNGLVIFSIYRISSQPYISVFCYMTLYYYFQSFNAMRQYIAIGMILVAYSFLRQSKFIKYFIGVFAAMLFHNSAIVGFLLLPYHFIRISNKGSMNILRSLIFPFVIGGIVTISFNFGLNLLVAIFPKYALYLQMAEYFEGIDVLQPIVINSFIFLAYTLLTDDREFILPLGTAVALSFMISSVGMLSRFVWFFDIFSIFAIARIWNTNLFEVRSKFFLRCAIIFSCLSFMTYYLYMNVMRVANYSFSILK